MRTNHRGTHGRPEPPSWRADAHPKLATGSWRGRWQVCDPSGDFCSAVTRAIAGKLPDSAPDDNVDFEISGNNLIRRSETKIEAYDFDNPDDTVWEARTSAYPVPDA